MRGWVVVVVALLLVGCNATGGGTPTLTPAAVPTDAPTPRPDVAPGVGQRGVEDSFALAEAHRSVLDDTAYTLTTNTSISGANGSLKTERTRTRVSNEAYHYVQVERVAPTYPVSATAPRIDVYYDGERALYRSREGNETTYQRDPTPRLSGPLFDPSNGEQVATLFGAFDRQRVERVSMGRPRYRIEASGLRETHAIVTPALLERPHDVTFEALLTPRGVVRSYRLRYDARFENRTVRVVETMRVSGVGTTSVERPPWYENANETTTVESA